MKSTRSAFRYFGQFEDKPREYTVGYYTTTLRQTIDTSAQATSLVDKICEYAVAHNKTKQMALQYSEIENAYEIQIEEEQKQMRLILTEYEKRLAIQLKSNQRLLEIELEHYSKVIDQLMIENNFTLQKLKSEYDLNVKFLNKLYKQKDMLSKFYTSIKTKANFKEVNELSDGYTEVVRKIMEIEKNII